VAPPGLHGIHTQCLTVHHLINDPCGRKGRKKMKEKYGVNTKYRVRKGTYRMTITSAVEKGEQRGNERRKSSRAREWLRWIAIKKNHQGSKHAFSCYNHAVWCTVGINDMAEESFSQFITREPILLISFPLILTYFMSCSTNLTTFGLKLQCTPMISTVSSH